MARLRQTAWTMAGFAAGGALMLSAATATTPLESASGWATVHNARAGLIGGGAAELGGKGYMAGLQIQMAQGWKTYWRVPGDAGVPPTFDWTGSENVGWIAVRYPAPMRLVEPAAQTIGYKSAVLFPVEVVPQDATKPVTLRLSAEFGVCREICIPAHVQLDLALRPDQLANSTTPAIRAALDRVPRAADALRANDPRIDRLVADLDGAKPRLLVEARYANGGAGADLFIEAADGSYVPLPKRLPDADGKARFEVDLAPGGNAKDLKGQTLTLTLVSDAGESEATWTLP